MIRTIVFGLAGAFLAAFPDNNVLLGFAVGVMIAQYLRLADLARQLRRRLDSLERPGEVQQPPARAAQPAVATAAPLPATPPAPERPTHAPEPLAGRQRHSIAALAAAPRGRIPAAIRRILERFSTTTRIGIVVLFLGVSFLLKYAADHGVFPIEARLLCVLALGAVIYQVGRKLQPRERNYGLLLRGAGIGIWYLSCYAASSLYHLISHNLSLLLLIALSAFTAWNAVRHNARAMAAFGVAGGFLAPLLLASGTGSHTILFTYYTVVNASIVAIAYRQTWRELPLIGFVFTFVIAAFWGATSYRPAYFSSTEPFLLLSAAFYMAVPLLFANQARHGKQPLFSNLIVFGTPAVTFALQLRLVAGFDDGAAWSALLFGAAYAAVLLPLWRKLATDAPLLRDAMVGIAAVFLTLAIAFAFEQELAGALWALEAAGGVWLSVRQQRKWGCYLSLVILAGSGALWLSDVHYEGERLLLNSAYLQIALIALSGLCIGFILDTQRRLLHAIWARLATAWAAAWWIGGGVWQFVSHLPDDHVLNALGVYILCSGAALLALFIVTARHLAGYLAEHALLVLAALGLIATVQTGNPLSGLGIVVWPVSVCYLYAANYLLSGAVFLRSLVVATYLFAAALTLALSCAECYRLFTAHYPGPAGRVIALTVPPLLAFWLLQGVRLWRTGFVELHQHTITHAVLLLLMLCFFAGLPIPPGITTAAGTRLAWPLNLVQIATLVAVARWWQQRGPATLAGTSRGQGWMILGVCAFLLINALLLRHIHLHHAVAFEASSLFRSDSVQTSLSVLWTVIGVVAVMWASRNAHGALWHMGMGLLAVVVAKLFLVDLSQSGTVERIVSFIAVGLLLMIVGWKSPRPPRATVATPAAERAAGTTG